MEDNVINTILYPMPESNIYKYVLLQIVLTTTDTYSAPLLKTHYPQQKRNLLAETCSPVPEINDRHVHMLLICFIGSRVDDLTRF